ncbi:PLP-dependent aminotransferase family protein [Corynebacterium sp. Marseille-P3884]|nr:PLP-dependent aminotransferase family protein [Corynebacterium sp. Marseille-P3884]MBP3947503.1 PLP-dependent aminotransferase family protein [Corynebacterium sp. Marseille-P3884]
MLIDVTRSLPIPLTTQVAASIRSAISSGALRPGDEVPSTRVLARQAGVSRGTIVTAYDQLISEGYLTATQGAPTRVNPSLPDTDSRSAQPVPPTPSAKAIPRPPRSSPSVISLKPSSGHAGAIRPAAWRQAWREAAADPAVVTEPTGQQQLRQAIAEHLRMGRGLNVDKRDVVVTGGTREGLVLVLTAVAGGNRLRVGVEDPGHPGLRNVIPLTGHTSVPCPVDDAGVNLDTLPNDLDVLLVTPSYQYPLGASMPATRRRALLDWAAETDTVIIEDDFNAELRYRTSPVPPLAALQTSAHVVTLGTFSTLLTRSVAAGYVASTSPPAEDIRRTRAVMGMPVAAVTQLAIAHLLRNGHVRRNTKAVHNRLAKRREIVAAEIIPQLLRHGATVTEMAESNGVDLAVTFPSPSARDTFARQLADQGIESGRLDALWSGRDDGLVVSFAHLSESDFRKVLEVMRSGSST